MLEHNFKTFIVYYIHYANLKKKKYNDKFLKNMAFVSITFHLLKVKIRL